MIKLTHLSVHKYECGFVVLPTALFSMSVGIAVDREVAGRFGALAQLGARIAGSDEVTSSSLVCSTNIG